MPNKLDLHERIEREDAPATGSERGFGIVFSILFLIIGLYPLIYALPLRMWALGVSALFLILAFFLPSILSPLNRAWYVFGLMLHKVVNPIVMCALFFFTVTPIALLLKIFGKDPLQRHFDSVAKSYWIERNPPGPEPDTMRQQF
ncbi:MAG: SxtJ family membrane protein [Pseudomonadota bacterium]|nr:SxtJ family membrane protein [Pseudomonadota bacterium]